MGLGTGAGTGRGDGTWTGRGDGAGFGGGGAATNKTHFMVSTTFRNASKHETRRLKLFFIVNLEPHSRYY